MKIIERLLGVYVSNNQALFIQDGAEKKLCTRLVLEHLIHKDIVEQAELFDFLEALSLL